MPFDSLILKFLYMQNVEICSKLKVCIIKQSLKGYHPIGEDFYWEAMTLISTSIKGAASGTVYTDDTDPRGNDKEALMYQIDKRRKVRWHIK